MPPVSTDRACTCGIRRGNKYHANGLVSAWQQEYNDERPKKSLGGMTPSAYAKTLTQKPVTLTPDSKVLALLKREDVACEGSATEMPDGYRRIHPREPCHRPCWLDPFWLGHRSPFAIDQCAWHTEGAAFRQRPRVRLPCVAQVGEQPTFDMAPLPPLQAFWQYGTYGKLQRQASRRVLVDRVIPQSLRGKGRHRAMSVA